jgi:Leucine-rich repeat (LRR) protein
LTSIKKIFFILFVFIKQINAQTYVLIPDTNFVNYLQSVIPSAMLGDSLNTSSTLVTAITQTINVSLRNISNLNGIQYFTSLKFLNCWGNALTNLPNLPDSLNYLSCYNNPHLKILPILPNTLETLLCYGDSLTSLSSIPDSLHYLDCSQNHITNIPTLNASLQSLECYNNLLVSLPALPSSLNYLNCGNNLLTILPNLDTTLQTLQCYKNALTTLPTLPNSLINLNCGNNFITIIPSLNNSLQTLECNNNLLNTLPILYNSISYLTCSHNPLTNLPILPNSLHYLDCSFDSLITLPALPDSLTYLYCENNKITCFPLFPNSILSATVNSFGTWTYYLNINSNPFTCLPNYLSNAMNPAALATPICAAGNANGCTVITGLDRVIDNSNELIIYPNPTNSSVNLKAENIESCFFELNNNLGQIVIKKEKITQSLTQINTADLPNGLYVLQIICNEKNITWKKLIVQH